MFTLTQAINEASRCLYCEDAPCKKGCPAGIDVRTFINRIKTENFSGSVKTLLEENALADICGLVCPADNLCERECNSKLVNHPIRIKNLQHFVCDCVYKKDSHTKKQSLNPNKSVAVIGAGPAGLSCAYYLTQKGISAEIYEKTDQPGGVLLSCIPEYRLPKTTAKREISRILKNVRTHYNSPLSEKINPKKLLENGFSAVFLGIGLGDSAKLNIPGENLKGVVDAITFLKKIKTYPKTRVPDTVAVIGGGNIAIDSAITAKKRGASNVYILYRRSFDEMPAWKEELQDAINSGIHVMVLTAPIRFVGKNSLERIECRHTTLGKPDKSGRRTPLILNDSRLFINAKMCVNAVGQKTDKDAVKYLNGIRLNPNGTIWVDKNFQTTLKNVYAGGDAVNGGTTVVQAVAEGRKVAENILHIIGVF